MSSIQIGTSWSEVRCEPLSTLIPDIRDLPDETTTAAITFGDCVVSHGPISQTTLFHEFVHVEQYREFGIQRFADLYLRGFLNAGSYFEIPLRRIAYTLGERFENNPTRPFPVPVAHTPLIGPVFLIPSLRVSLRLV